MDDKLSSLEMLSYVDYNDELLRSLVRYGLEIGSRGSDLTDVKLFQLINSQIPRDNVRNQLRHRMMIQFAQVRTHQFYLSEKRGCHIDPTIAFNDWIQSYAGKFAKEYHELYEKIAA